jgi:hypothetical protein
MAEALDFKLFTRSSFFAGVIFVRLGSKKRFELLNFNKKNYNKTAA